MHGGATGQPIPTFASGCKFDALEELFIQIQGGGQASSINQVRKTIFCQRNHNVEMTPPPITECPIPTLSASNVPGKCMDDGP